ncbi:MAG: cob(I)yrinic acid a,c-diamide adenosyltransferase [Armatimonadota bacterium]|nr:MAG: cob(I)yrinic acid a,c-diamide adenosyltransferase [Armatimonadota bacterium]
MPQLERGLIQVYTGDGKGKSTAAWGQALRAAGRGLRVCVIMFLKGDADLGELHAAQQLAPGITARQFGASREELASRSTGPWWQAGYTDDDRRMAREGLDFARAAIDGGEYDLVVLDEANVALSEGLLDTDEVLALLRGRPQHVEVILTGRNAPPPVLDAADLVTEMRSVKHPFDSGRPARPGIEY